MPGVVRTRVGYAGGTKENPTYYSLGDHSETIQIDYDPTVISYRDLLNVFWNSHSPTSRPWSQQYASIIFYHSSEQEQAAIETKAQQENRLGQTIYTEIRPCSEFYTAEAYHQKYYLRNAPVFLAEFRAMYPEEEDFVNSTAAARVNGYLGGNGTVGNLRAEIDSLGLSPESAEELMQRVAPGTEPEDR